MKGATITLAILSFANYSISQKEDLTPQEIILKSELNKQEVKDICLTHFNFTCFNEDEQQEHFEVFSDAVYKKVKHKFIKELITNVNFSNYDAFILNESNTIINSFATQTCAELETLIQQLEENESTPHNHTAKAGGNCTNPDFEMCDFTNWELFNGEVPGGTPFSINNITETTNYANIVNGATFLPGTDNHAITSGGTDVNGGFPMVNPNGSCSALLGDFEEAGANASILKQTFQVSPNDNVLILNYAAVLEDPNHIVEEQPYFKVRVYDYNGDELVCGSYEAFAGDGQPAWQMGGGMSFLPWTTVMIPLNNYIEQEVTVEFTVGDCSLGGHSGYAYVDASCQSLALTITGDDDCSFPVTINAPVGAANYAWSNGETTSSIDVMAPGNFDVAIIPNAGPACAATLDTVIIDFNYPIADAGIDATICQGETTQLDGSGGNTYQWNNAITLNNNGLPNPTAQPNTTTEYILTVEGDVGCFDEDTVMVTVVPFADATINPENALCDNSTPINFTALENGGSWTGTGITNNINGVFNPSIAGEGTHTISYTIAGLCPDTQTTTILVEPFLDPTISQAGPFCFTENNIQLNSVDAGGIWSGNGIVDANNGLFNPSLAGVGTHLISYTTPGGCGGTDQVNIVVEANVDASILPVEPLCFNAPAFNLSSVENGGIWSGVGITNPNLGTFNPVTAGAGTHTITYSLNGICSDFKSIQIEIFEPMTVADSPDTTICEGNYAQISAFAYGGTGNYNFNWDNGFSTSTQLVSSVNTTHYAVEITDGCTTENEIITVNIEFVPQINFSADNLSGCIPMEVELNNFSDAGSVSCFWTVSNGFTSDDCNGISTTFYEPGCYDVQLQLTTANGCTDSMSYNNYICVEEAPEAIFLPSTTTLSLFDTEVEFTNMSNNAVSYEWLFGFGLGTSNAFEPTYSYPQVADQYTTELVATSAYGCTDTAFVVIEVLDELIVYVPNTFTPDANGVNEIWKPVFDSGYDPQSLTLYIFNRWGEIIWQSHDANAGWNGTYGGDGSPVKDGTYIWKMEFAESFSGNKHLMTGHVNVLK